ncbi:hypothetical protein IFM47457_06188 [Aspergillus lentulus]|uniref:Uncharacterized protein n=1 Tax=Aspergillus lentulus TaxID=293939 RepID=A0ABQ1B222_ASPLE|nr:hypothetical protein IFM62136_05933 [Aspergillus lentulus]GFF83592.1 hypothetical protein IFM47457_06188 [Aspergillus lentulus]GFF92298.1 hypothetical protein IFM60648_09698 [Aspergillus lentulus]
MSDGIHTYTGPWINWSEGVIRGATLTLSQKHAGVLSAFLAILVSFAGTLFWSILSFVIHQAYTTEPTKGQDALHSQRQIILRNKTAAGAAWALIMLPFENGRTASRVKAIGRSLPLAVLAILNILLFSVSGLFTSYITKTAGKSTIIVGPGCGGFTYNTSDSIVNSKSLQDTYEAATYVRQCYQGSPSGLICGTYARPSIPFTTNQNASCPFASELCAYNDRSAFEMDTGLLDSQADFGINARSKDRIKFRRVTTCAPVKHGSGLGTVQNDSTYGELLYINAGLKYYMGQPYTNYTFIYTPSPQVDGIGYTLSTVFSKGDPTGLLMTTRTWVPDSRINQTDADITMMMLNQNGVMYLQPSYDPWITADVENNLSVENTTYSKTLWSKSYEANLLVCVDQYQVCNPSRSGDSGCTKLGSQMSTFLSAFETDGATPILGFNLRQLTTVARFLSANTDRSMFSNVNGRGGAALNASMMVYLNLNSYIPPNQWQIEVWTWFATSLAKEQAWAFEWATEPKNLPAESLGQGWNVTPPINEAARYACRNQLMNNASGYENFSILGLALALIVCGLIVIFGLTVDAVVGWLRRGKTVYKRDQWAVEETLALHKAAYTNLGLWRDNGEEMPSSSILLSNSTQAIPLGAELDAEGVGTGMKHGYAVVGHEVQ